MVHIEFDIDCNPFIDDGLPDLPAIAGEIEEIAKSIEDGHLSGGVYSLEGERVGKYTVSQ